MSDEFTRLVFVREMVTQQSKRIRTMKIVLVRSFVVEGQPTTYNLMHYYTTPDELETLNDRSTWQGYDKKARIIEDPYARLDLPGLLKRLRWRADTDRLDGYHLAPELCRGGDDLSLMMDAATPQPPRQVTEVVMKVGKSYVVRKAYQRKPKPDHSDPEYQTRSDGLEL